MTKNLKLWAMVTGVALSFTAFAEKPKEEKNWTFQFEPYVMATNISGDAGINGLTGKVDLGFSDILDNLSSAGMLHFETYYKNRWGLMLDYGFMDLENDKFGPLGNGKVSLRQGVFEAAAVHRLSDEDSTLDLFAGIRWWDNEVTVEGPLGNKVGISEDWVDVILGMRYMKPVTEKLTLFARGDVGGFGLESDFTASASAGGHYSFTDWMALDLQYKATWVDYKSNSFEYDTVTHGAILGLVFKF